jgi:hypothetical protein
MPGVFISYRRQDSAGHTGRLFDRLKLGFGADRVFFDIVGIDAGADFVRTLEQTVGSCDLLLAVIGPEWLTALDAQGKRRLDDPDDFVRLEIASALRRETRVIPVLIAGASMPSTQALPDDLKPLARRQAIELRDTRWDADVSELLKAVEPQLRPRTPARRTAGKKIAVAMAATVVALAAVGLAMSHSRDRTAAVRTSGPEATAATAPVVSEVSLDYAILARRNPDRDPQSAQVRLAGANIVSPGDLLRLSVRPAQDGFLYVLNESFSTSGGETSLNVLFPSPTANNGTPRLNANRTLLIPERGRGFEVDAEDGPERLWLVWSANAVNELEAVAHWANERDQGEIKSSQDASMVRNFLRVHASPAPRSEDSSAEATTLKARGDMFVKLVTLEHRK